MHEVRSRSRSMKSFGMEFAAGTVETETLASGELVIRAEAETVGAGSRIPVAPEGVASTRTIADTST